jgi:RimJ/RimL family protein N-acetyltransferase
MNDASPVGSSLFLRRARDEDLAALHALMSHRDVYLYLADDSPPTRELLDGWIQRSHASFESRGVGLWLLDAGGAEPAGCVLLEVDLRSGRADLTYALAPRFWHRGLATRMSWTAIRRAFEASEIAEVVAGADEPNIASLAVMRRLGMKRLRRVQYPLHAGVECVLRRADEAPERLPEEIPIL